MHTECPGSICRCFRWHRAVHKNTVPSSSQLQGGGGNGDSGGGLGDGGLGGGGEGVGGNEVGAGGGDGSGVKLS